MSLRHPTAQEPALRGSAGARDGLLRSMAAGDPAALREFGDRFGGLAVALTRKMLPEAPSRTRQRLAQRALQACVDELPLVAGASLERGGSLDAWVAVVCGRALHEALARRQLDAAAQRAAELLPAELPKSRYFELKAYYRPAELLSGDYYDACLRADGSVLVLLADVMGHGAPAALLVAAVKCAFRSSAQADSAAQTLGAMNRALEGVLPPSCFVAASAMRLGARRGECEFANAGMGRAYVVSRRGGSLAPLDQPANLLGLFADARYEGVRLSLEPGDRLFLCTDGAADLQSPAGERFGHERLREVLRQAAPGGNDLCQAVSSALASFGGGAGWYDDVCLLTATAG